MRRRNAIDRRGRPEGRVAPKPAPVIVAVVPTGPIAGARPLTDRDSITVNDALLLEKLSSTTVTEPLVALAGTVAVTLASLQAVTVAAIPLKSTWLPLALGPKPEPLNVTVPPMGAAGGAKLVITGLIAVNVVTGTLAIEFTVTLTGPGPEGTEPRSTSAAVARDRAARASAPLAGPPPPLPGGRQHEQNPRRRR